MQMSRRESVLLLVTGAAVLFGVSYFVLQGTIAAFQEAGAEQKRLQNQIDQNRMLSAQRGVLEGQYQELRARLPRHGAKESTATIYQSRIYTVSRQHDLTLLTSEPGEERTVGEIRELPIDYRSWQGTLDGLVHFLFDLQKTGTLFDVRYLNVKPTRGQQLQGRFVLYCAYTRAIETEERTE